MRLTPESVNADLLSPRHYGLTCRASGVVGYARCGHTSDGAGHGEEGRSVATGPTWDWTVHKDTVAPTVVWADREEPEYWGHTPTDPPHVAEPTHLQPAGNAGRGTELRLRGRTVWLRRLPADYRYRPRLPGRGADPDLTQARGSDQGGSSRCGDSCAPPPCRGTHTGMGNRGRALEATLEDSAVDFRVTLGLSATVQQVLPHSWTK